MLKYIVILICLMTICKTTPLNAELNMSNLEIIPHIEFGYFSYNEHINKPKKSNEYGIISNLRLETVYKLPVPHITSHFYVTYGQQLVRYDGSSQDGTAINYFKNNQILTYEGVLSYQLSKNQSHSVKFLAGLGTHYWDRHLSYNELYNWIYMPMGIHLTQAVNNHFNVGIKALIKPKLSSTLQIRGLIDEDFELHLGNLPGYQIEIPIHYTSDTMTISVNLWYQQSELGKSNYKLIYYNNSTYKAHEPSSTTRILGIRTNIRF